MATDKLGSLEVRIRQLLELTQELKRENTGLKTDVRAARERLVRQDQQNQRWRQERTDIKARLDRVMEDLELLETWEESKEGAAS